MRARTKLFDDAVKTETKPNPAVNARASASETLVPAATGTGLMNKNASQQSAELQPSSARWSRISLRAYELAEQRGFAAGTELGDWLQAEKDIDSADM